MEIKKNFSSITKILCWKLFFDRFFKAIGKVCNLNLPAETCCSLFWEKVKCSIQIWQGIWGIIISKEKIKTNQLYLENEEKFIGSMRFNGAMVKFKILKKTNVKGLY